MKIISPGKSHYSHVMWEPIGSCNGICKGCYQAFSPSRNYNGIVQTDVLENIFINRSVCADQLTISLNSTEVTGNCLAILMWVWQKYGGRRDRLLPELCLTVRSYQEIKNLQSQLKFSDDSFFRALSVISISDLEGTSWELWKELGYRGIDLNYNFLVRSDAVPPYDMFGKCKQPFGEVHSVYLLLEKKPLGDEQNIESLRNWCAYYYYKNSMVAKIIPDSCVVEAFRYLKSGYVCSAGIDKVCCWADGVDTACPYDTKRVRKIGYPAIGYCTIPQTILQLQREDPSLVENTMQRLGI